MGGLVCNHPRCLECPKERTCRYRYTEADNEPTAPRALAIKRAPTNAKVSLRLFIDTLLLLLAIMGALFAIAINYSGG